MSEPLSFEAVRDTLLYHAGQLPESALPMCVRWALEEIDSLRAQLAALAPLQDLLKDVREDNDLRRAAEIGAARERGACAATCDEYAEGPLHAGLVNESAVLHSAANKIRRRGPCLLPLPEEGELERLRAENAELREAYNNTAG